GERAPRAVLLKWLSQPVSRGQRLVTGPACARTSPGGPSDGASDGEEDENRCNGKLRTAKQSLDTRWWSGEAGLNGGEIVAQFNRGWIARFPILLQASFEDA